MATARQAYRAEQMRARRSYFRKLLGLIALLLFLSLLLFTGMRYISPENMPVKRVLIEGDLQHVARSLLTDTIALQVENGFFRVDLDRVESAVERLPWVATAKARRAWPDTLLVRVTEQVPIARWGTDRLLNSRGEIFQPDGDLPESLPLIFGPDGRERYLIEQYHRAAQLLRSTGLGLDALMEDERRSWTIVIDNGLPVSLGRIRPEDKILRFTRIYSRTLADKVDKVASVDMRYPNGFAVAWKPSAKGGRGAK